MKKNTLLIVIFIFSISNINPKEGFFLQNRNGVLVRIDIESMFNFNYPKLKGPSLKDVPVELAVSEFQKKYLSSINENNDLDFVKSAYIIDNDKYIRNKDFSPIKISSSIIKKNIITNLADKEKTIFYNFYKLDKKHEYYSLVVPVSDENLKVINENVVPFILRIIFLNYNKDNEMYTGIDYGNPPAPHNFPRVFDAKSKSAIDIHVYWGWKDINGSKVSLGFAFKLTNIIMPSLEILVKYNFVIENYNFVEPFIGAALYGGFIDGFPIGWDILGGADFYPTVTTDDKTNFFVTAETRLGLIMYSKIYFDTGMNNEGIWKKRGFLAEGGFFYGIGYRWD